MSPGRVSWGAGTSRSSGCTLPTRKFGEVDAGKDGSLSPHARRACSAGKVTRNLEPYYYDCHTKICCAFRRQWMISSESSENVAIKQSSADSQCISFWHVHRIDPVGAAAVMDGFLVAHLCDCAVEVRRSLLAGRLPRLVVGGGVLGAPGRQIAIPLLVAGLGRHARPRPLTSRVLAQRLQRCVAPVRPPGAVAATVLLRGGRATGRPGRGTGPPPLGLLLRFRHDRARSLQARRGPAAVGTALSGDGAGRLSAPSNCCCRLCTSCVRPPLAGFPPSGCGRRRSLDGDVGRHG